jgi:hypothetical protein
VLAKAAQILALCEVCIAQTKENTVSSTIYRFLRYIYDAFGNGKCGAACHGFRVLVMIL